MIRQLVIKNLAIIDDITLDLKDSLNVLSGQTGAGKSIIIDAISLIFGARANADLVASNKDFAYISVDLSISEINKKKIKELIDLEIDDEFIIVRTISKDGKSSLKINGISTSLHELNEIAPLLIDISSQNESNSLLNHKYHLGILHNYILKDNPNYLDNYTKLYKEYLNIKNELNKLNENDVNPDELEFYEYKYNELKDYNYTLDDEDNINDEYKKISSILKNEKVIEDIIGYLDDDASGALINIYEAIKGLNQINNEYSDKFNSLYLDLDDLTKQFKKDYYQNDIDEDRLNYLSDEITKINRLKRKYNSNDLLKVKNDLKEKIDLISTIAIKKEELNKKLLEITVSLEKEASKISNTRKEYGFKLASSVIKELNDLYLKDASFSVHVDKINEFNKFGNDDISFYMSANKGVEQRPLIAVASGGEVSRIMLGLKSVFVGLSNVETVIFDEIDAGVSGAVALAMGKKMLSIAKNVQVLTISHLPQVVALSTHHFYIYKEVVENKTTTMVKLLSEEEKVLEVARLLSGDDIKESFIASAKELIALK